VAIGQVQRAWPLAVAIAPTPLLEGGDAFFEDRHRGVADARIDVTAPVPC
jgi:hypothetical protein